MNTRSLICTGALLALPFAAGCSDDGGSDVDAAADPGVDAPPGGNADAAPGPDAPPGSTFTITWEGVTVEPGTEGEDTRCVVKRLGNTERIYVDRIHNSLGNASHHMIIYKVNDDEEQTEPFSCDPFFGALGGGSPLMISQTAEDELTLPENVAFSLAPNQMIRIELHYFNVSDEPVDVVASTTFYTTPKTDELQAAGFVFMGTSDIKLPPKTDTSLPPVYFPLAGSGLESANYFAITGHTHKLGLDVHVSTAVNETDTASDVPVYDVEGFDWEEPETVYYKEDPFQVPDGGGFRFSCDYKNTTDFEVGFGESATEEMCFFWTYYYPSDGSKVCIESGGFAQCLNAG